MSDQWKPVPGHTREQSAIALTRFVLQKHYWESNVAADESIFDEPFFWFGAAEPEFSVDREAVLSLFRQFPGKVPKCNITGEDFHATMIAPDVCMVAGRFWVATDPSTNVYIRFHQRISTCVRWRDGKAKLCMLHLSIPYAEMIQDDVGFPTQVAQHTYEYMQEQLALQRAKIKAQTAELSSIYHTVSCGILRLLRKDGQYRLLTCNQTLAKMVGRTEEEVWSMDWSCGFAQDVLPEDRPRIQDALARLQKPGDRSTLDYRGRTQSGGVLYLNCSNHLISEDENGQIIQRLTYDISQRVELEAALKRMSFEDGLTGLFNRTRFNQTFARFQQQPPRQLGVACFDLNGLKEWNDQWGHIAGDQLIQRTAAHIGAVFPQKSYRIGGDEFVVLDEESDEETFHGLVERARAWLRQSRISISIGSCWSGCNCNPHTQLNEADQRMYEEKKAFYRTRDTIQRRG